jgi:hypothetical protein
VVSVPKHDPLRRHRLEHWRPAFNNTLANDVLSVGEIYEVMHINEREGYYALSGLGRFTMTRFKLVSAAEAGYWPSRRRRSPAGEEPNPS